MAEQVEYGKRNAVTGERWAHVGRAAAHRHPKGRLHWSLVAIALWLFASAAMTFAAALGFGGLGAALGLALLPALVGILVLLRAPIARPLLIGLGGVSVYRLIDSGAYAGGYMGLIETLILVAITIYMWEGERPNLAYGYRFRSRLPAPGPEAASERGDG